MTIGEAKVELRSADSVGRETLADPANQIPTDGIIGHATGWIEATRERARSVTHLAFAEARLAALSIALMAFFGLLSAMFLLGAWGLLVAGLVHALVQAGLALWIVLLLLGAAHLLAAWLLWRSVMRLSRHLEFAATRAQLRRDPPGRASP